jgi:hypothetical protein
MVGSLMIQDMNESDRVNQLVEHLNKASEILNTHGFDFWASWLRGDILQVQKFEVSGLEHLLSAFGGMGSINDVRIETASPSESGELNLLLRFHLSEIFNLASSLMPR